MAEGMEQIREILNKFNEWLKTDEAKDYVTKINRDKKEVRELMKKLSKMDKSSKEFDEWVLYGLLPYGKSAVAKRESAFPAMQDIKKFWEGIGRKYSDKEWNHVANMIFDLAKGFEDSRVKLKELIVKFSNDKYSWRLQCGVISPILFGIDSKYPLVNNPIIATYQAITSILGRKDKLSQKLIDYPENMVKINNLIKQIGFKLLEDQGTFDLFCFWWVYFENSKISMKDDSGLGGEIKREVLTKKVFIVPVNMNEFLRKLDIEKFKKEEFHFSKNLGVKVREILNNVETRWVLPNFQRYYDWDKEDVRAFLESIFNDYFVGSILLWDVVNEPDIATFSITGVKQTIKKPESIILDGQQRITSLYYAIRTPEIEDDKIKSYFYIDFKNFFEGNSKDRVVLSKNKYDLKDSAEAMLFPLYELENYTKWIREFDDLYDKDDVDRRKLKEVIRIMEDRIRHILTGFNIPEIRLPPSMKLHHVVDIFENINTKGKLLDAFDLLIAASSKHKIDLRHLWETSCDTYPNLIRYSNKTKNKIRMYIIQAISLLYHPTNSCKKSDILEIYEQIYHVKNGGNPSMFEKHWGEMSKYIELAIRKIEDLKDGFGAVNEDYVPFMPTIPLLAALLKEADSQSNKYDCKKKIKQLYWSVIFNEAYSSAVDSQLTADFKAMKAWFLDDSKVPEQILEAKINIQTLNLRKINTLSSAVYKGVLALLTLKGSRDLQTGEMVRSIEEYHKDHLFPQSKKDKYHAGKNIDSILNMSWLTQHTNQSKGAKDPKDYFKEFSKKFKGNRQEYLEVLDSHYITKIAYESLISNDFEKFIAERENVLIEEIKKLLGVNNRDYSNIESSGGLSSLLKSDEGETLEFKSTFKKNIETGQSDENMRFAVLKSIAGFLNARGGRLILGFDEKNKKVIGLNEDYELTKRKDKDSFQLEFWSYLESNIDKSIVKKNIDISFESIQDKEVAIILVKRGDTPVFLKKNGKKILYVRNRNETDNLEDPEEIHSYIEEHF